jgi:DNA-directed RNA polymerase specialized sigma24 family protein
MNRIKSLDEPLRTILERQAGGVSLKQIARDDGLPYWQVWRLSRRGMEQLRYLLNGASDM